MISLLVLALAVCLALALGPAVRWMQGGGRGRRAALPYPAPRAEWWRGEHRGWA